MADLLPELNTRSVLNVVEENFTRIKLKTYACRMIYAGEHTLKREEIMKIFENTLKTVNSSYCEVPVHGLLLVYDNYFIHVIEGSEDTIHRQIRFLFKAEKDYIANELKKREEIHTEGLAEVVAEDKNEVTMFRRIKVLMVYHSITTRLFSNWQAVPIRPPALVTKLDIYSPMAQHIEQLKICLDKIEKTCYFLLDSEKGLHLESLSAADHKLLSLPEGALLDFLLSSKYVLDLREVFRYHRRVDDYTYYFEQVWPLPTHNTPRLMYKLKIDDTFVEPLPIMPWEKKESEEDEREERSIHSSLA